MKTRNQLGRYSSLKIDKEYLYQKYVVEKLLPREIAKELQVSNHVIYDRLHEYRIELRKQTHSLKNHKIECPCGVCKITRGAIFAENSPRWKGGITLKEYFCKCGNKISMRTALYGGGCCRDCWHEQESTRMIMGRNKGSIPWNKGILNSTGNYWLGKSNKDVISKHHIDGNRKNNSLENFLELPQGDHSSLHWRGYEYLVEIGLVYDYLKDFCLKYEIVDTKDKIDGKVVHHIDCKRNNNDESNFMYLKDKKIHTKLHREAYRYLVRINKVCDYIRWFFLLKRKNNQNLKVIEELK